MSDKKTGTREWAEHSANCVLGCEHNCRYCYARANAVRFGRATHESWRRPLVNASEMGRAWKRRAGTIMFPTAHDITPDTMGHCLEYLRNILRAGNRVLIVTKPHVECVEVLCRELLLWQREVLWRMTIGAMDSRILRYWEPGAPDFPHRLQALILARMEGYQTSVSIEPMLDPEHVLALVDKLRSWVSESLWLGKMNHIRQRVAIVTEEDRRQVEALERAYRDEEIMRIVRALQGDPLVRWKDSIRDVIERNAKA